MQWVDDGSTDYLLMPAELLDIVERFPVLPTRRIEDPRLGREIEVPEVPQQFLEEMFPVEAAEADGPWGPVRDAPGEPPRVQLGQVMRLLGEGWRATSYDALDDDEYEITTSVDFVATLNVRTGLLVVQVEISGEMGAPMQHPTVIQFAVNHGWGQLLGPFRTRGYRVDPLSPHDERGYLAVWWARAFVGMDARAIAAELRYIATYPKRQWLATSCVNPDELDDDEESNKHGEEDG